MLVIREERDGYNSCPTPPKTTSRHREMTLRTIKVRKSNQSQRQITDEQGKYREKTGHVHSPESNLRPGL